MTKIAVTGHRPDKLWGYELSHPKWQELKHRFKDIIKKQLMSDKEIEMISGMALGTDTVYALAAIELKDEGFPVKLIAAVPFVGQESKWPAKSQRAYKDILYKADEIHIVCDGNYAPWKMQKRNEWMVNHAESVIAVWDGTSGGTANCVKYAEQVFRPIIRINPKDI